MDSFQDEINKAQELRKAQIYNSFEKAKVVGQTKNVNGKTLVWTKTPGGFDWRISKTKSKVDIKYTFKNSKTEDWDYDLNLTHEGKLIGVITFWENKLYPKHLSVGDANIYDDKYKSKGYYQKGLHEAVKFAKTKGFDGIVSDSTSRNKISDKAWDKIENKTDKEGDYYLEGDKIKYSKVTTLAQIKADPRVDSVSYDRNDDDEAGVIKPDIWIYLKEGFINTESNTMAIHTSSIKQACEEFNDYVEKDKKWIAQKEN